jgi:glycosyltransferase involved in cell wall biosynthesis
VSGDDLDRLIADAAVLVYPSLFEGWGMPLTDAMAVGVPVVCSDIPVLHEVAGDAALYFDPLDPRSIASALRRVLNDRTLSETMIARGRLQTSGLTWRAAAARLVALQLRTAGRPLSDPDRAAYDQAIREAHLVERSDS